MSSSFTEPCGYPDLHQFRLVGMYTRASTKRNNKKVLISFLVLSALLRVLIATAAFSMGIDCQDIYCAMHYGAPATVTEYVQETGRVGRDGNPAVALWYYGNPGKHVDHYIN